MCWTNNSRGREREFRCQLGVGGNHIVVTIVPCMCLGHLPIFNLQDIVAMTMIIISIGSNEWSLFHYYHHWHSMVILSFSYANRMGTLVHTVLDEMWSPVTPNLRLAM